MNKQDIINYVLKTPHNSNPAVLDSILDDLNSDTENNADVFYKGAVSNSLVTNAAFSINYTSPTSNLNYVIQLEQSIQNITITELQIGGKIKTLKEGCLEGSTENLKKLIIKDGVENIEKGSVSYVGRQLVEDYVEVILGNTIKTIGKEFLSESNIKQIELPSSLEEIDTEFLYYSTNFLESVTFNSIEPPTIVPIQEYIDEYGEENIEEEEPYLWEFITDIDTLKELGIKVYVPAESINKYKTAYGWRLYSDLYQPIQK